MQKEVWPSGIKSLKRDGNERDAKTRDRIEAMTPFLDQAGLIRVGGRLQEANLTLGRKHPILVPDTPNGDALIGDLHSQTEHQGRKITYGLIRERGYHPIGGSNTVRRIIQACTTCRRQRAKPMEQKMADLPLQRLYRTPPFMHCGIDVFGPFHIKHGQPTRANQGTQKNIIVQNGGATPCWCL